MYKLSNLKNLKSDAIIISDRTLKTSRNQLWGKFKTLLQCLFTSVFAFVLFSCADTSPSAFVKTLSLPLKTGEELTSIALIYSQKHRGLNGFAVALNDGGAVIYSIDGDELWRDETPAKLVAYDGRALLIYRDHEERTILDRYSVGTNIQIEFEDRQMPSEVAATTLQRTTFSSLGSITLSDKTVNLPSDDFQSTLRYRSKRPVAAMASTSKSMPHYPNGMVVIASSDGHLELLSEDDFKSALR